MKTQIICKYGKELNGLRNIAAFWHNADINHPDKYNHWNFTSAKMWDGAPDSFYYHPNRTLLAMT